MKLTETTIIEKGRTQSGDTDCLKMRIPFLVLDKRNENGRVYSRAVTEAAVKAFDQRVKKAAAFGSSEHKKNMGLDDVAFMIEGAEVEGDKAFANIKLLSTRKGTNIRTILQAGGQVGVSARGKGDVGSDGTVKDYTLEGLDLVLTPAFPDLFANYGQVYESQQIEGDDDRLELHALYSAAVVAGYRGSYDEYVQIYLKGKEKQ